MSESNRVVTAPGIVQVRLQGRREDVDRYAAEMADVGKVWRSAQWYPDRNGTTGRRYVSVDVSTLPDRAAASGE